MTAWIARGNRLDIELSVALEIASLHLKNAQTLAEREQGLAYNLELWRVIGRLAATAPVSEDRESLLASAHLVAKSANPSVVIEQNVVHARTLAGRAATNGALRRLLEDWNSHRAGEPFAEFSRWILDRMDDFVPSVSIA